MIWKQDIVDAKSDSNAGIGRMIYFALNAVV